MYFALFSFGGGEIFIVLVAVLVLFGANKIPELARMLGKGMNEFRRATDDIKREFREGADEFKQDLEESKRDINHHIHEIGDTISETKDYDPYEEIDEEENSTPEAAHTLEENSPEPEAKSDIKSMAQPRPKKTNSKQTK